MSDAVITRLRRMGRWAPGAGGRLQQAAYELFAERGYEQTTVADIAARAGLTERTFFRHYTDKREVFFAGQDGLVDLVVGAITDGPPLEAVVRAFEGATAFFVDRRAGARVRQEVVDAHPELQERELAKLARIAAGVAAALRERGVAEPAATLAAEAGTTIFRVGIGRWLADDADRELDEVLRETFAELRAVAAG
jgi:AcrR family transcriptional regulator